ncbi:hypothetical protein [Mycoplasmopsis bovis]|nr:hypothetical protein [Mycoplasmopsis bovis]
MSIGKVIPIFGGSDKRTAKRIKKRYFWVLKSAKFCVDVIFIAFA